MLTSLDILYIVLAIGIALMSIFLSILLVYSIFILRDINKATEAIKDSAERVQTMILKPLQMTHEILKYARPMVDVVEKRFSSRQEEEPKKKKSSSRK
jgi:uncharacterized protein YoxC